MIDEGVFQDRPLNEAVHDICQAYGGYFLLGSQDFDIGGGRKLYNAAYLLHAARRAIRRVPQDAAGHPRRIPALRRHVSRLAQMGRRRHGLHARARARKCSR